MDYVERIKLSEANVQAELYMALKCEGIQCELEYKIRRPNERGARLDVIIIKDGKIPAIIEVKNHLVPEKTKAEWHTKSQYKRYSRYGVPVLICPAMEYIADVVAQVQAILNKDHGLTNGLEKGFGEK